MEAWAKEVMHEYRRPPVYRQVIAKGVDQIWAIDLADMGEVASHNDGMRYILCIVDVFSRFAWCFPLRTKSADDVVDAIKPLMLEHKPQFIWSDSGKEFYNAKFKALLKSIGADIYSTYSDHKASIVERFNRTIKTMIWKQFLLSSNRKWVGVLDKLVSDYNNRVHRTLGITPAQARLVENKETVLKTRRPVKAGEPAFGLGQYVRIAVKKGTFEKGFHPTYSYQIYKIVGINMSHPITYLLEDYDGEAIDGSFYEADMVPVADSAFFPIEKVVRERTVKGERQKLVKFLGYTDPRWRPAAEVADLA